MNLLYSFLRIQHLLSIEEENWKEKDEQRSFYRVGDIPLKKDVNIELIRMYTNKNSISFHINLGKKLKKRTYIFRFRFINVLLK